MTLLSPFLPKRFKYQLLLLVGLLFAAAMLLFTHHLAHLQHAQLLALHQQHADAWVKHVIEEARHISKKDAHLAEYLDLARQTADADYMILWRPDGAKWLSSQRDGRQILPQRFAPPPGLSPQSGEIMVEEPGRLILWSAQTGGDGTVDAWVEASFVGEPVVSPLYEGLWVGLLLIALTLVLLLAFLHRPLRALEETLTFAARLNVRDGSTLVLKNAPQEIQKLVDALNQTSTELAGQGRALREERQRTTAILDSALDCIISIDNEGRITEFNPAAEKTFGYRREEVIGQAMGHLLIPTGFVRQGPEGSRAQDGQTAGILGHRREVMARRRNGQEFPAEIAVVAIHLGEKAEFTAYLRDITQRRQAAEALVQARDAAEEANRTKSEFLANMSHEIRTPMNAILGMTDLALDTQLTDEQHRYLVMVKNSADSLLGIVNEILDFSKIEAGHLDIELVSFDLRKTVGMAVRALAPRAIERNIELLIHVAHDIPDALVGDPHRIHQVLTNLLSNALKFTEQGEVEVSVQVFTRNDDKLTLQFNVRDTGIGIPREKQSLIFGAFAQADASTTRKYGGTGLGLAICERVITAMGGRIWVDSQFGKGSTFHFTMDTGVESDLAPLGLPVALRDLKVLVADDNEKHRHLLGEQLSDWGLRAVGVETGADAERRLTGVYAEPFDIVILDSSLSGPDTATLIEKVRTLPSPPRIILMHVFSDARQESAEPVDFPRLQKPLLPENLRTALLSVMGHDDDARGRPDPVKNPLPAGIGRPLDILLVEDNPINQTLATRLLEKRGHHMHVVDNGQRALDAIRTHAYDVVLMDVQMPIMGGFEATAAIREFESGAGRRTPIIAMTAHAMAGDKERCLAAGMDDYVSKPIVGTTLDDTLLRCLGHNAKPDSTPVPEGAPDMTSAPPFDRTVLMESLGGDVELYKEIVVLFLNHHQEEIGNLKRELAAGNPENLRRSAHSIKGAVSNFSAQRAVDAARTLEHTMKNEGLASNTADLVNEVIAAVEELAAALQKEAA